jgi:hypothetical protein
MTYRERQERIEKVSNYRGESRDESINEWCAMHGVPLARHANIAIH